MQDQISGIWRENVGPGNQDRKMDDQWPEADNSSCSLLAIMKS